MYLLEARHFKGKKSGFKSGWKCQGLEMYVQWLTAWGLEVDLPYSFHGPHGQLGDTESVT